MDRRIVRPVAGTALLALGLSGCCPPSAPPDEVHASAGSTTSVRTSGMSGGSQRASILASLAGPASTLARSPLAPSLLTPDELIVVESPDGFYIGFPVGPGLIFWTFCFYEELSGFEVFVLSLIRDDFSNERVVIGGYGYPSGLRFVDPADLSYLSATGLPPSVTVTDVAPVDLDGNGQEEVYAVYQSSGVAPGGVAHCNAQTAACQVLNGFPPFPGFGTGPTSIHTVHANGSREPGERAAPRALVVSTTSGVLRSADAGATWQPATGLPAGARVDDLEAAGSALFAVTAAGLHRSLDEGSSFSPVAAAAQASAIAVRGAEMWVGLTGTPASVLRSTDGGQTFTAGGSLGPARRVNSLASRDSGLYALTDAGAFGSTNGGLTFVPMNQGLTNASFSSIALGADGSIVAGGGGGYDGVVVSRDKGASFSRASGADYRNVSALAVAGTNALAATSTGTIRSVDGAATFTTASPTGLTGGAIRSLASSGSTILAGLSNGNVHRSTDGGASFSAAASGLAGGGGAVTHLSASGSLVLAGRTDGVHRSTDGGATFAPTSIVAVPGASSLTTALALSGSDALVARQSVSATSFANTLLRSTDGGLTFQDVTAGVGVTNTLFAVAVSGTRLYAAPFQGLLVSEDGGGSWRDLDARLSRARVAALAATNDRLHVATRGSSLWSLPLTPRESRLVPIVLDVGSGAARFTTELALTNRGTTDVTVTARYTASIGSGSGSGTTRLGAGQQLVLPDAITWLKGLGVPIAEGSAAGTLLLDFDGVSSPEVVAATARTGAGTSAPQPEGKAGLAYPGFDPATGAVRPLTVYGLRQNESDRSNLAVFSASDEPVTLRVTAYSGSGDGRTAVVAEETLPPRAWKQYNAVLGGAGMTTGWVTVERTSSTGSFGCYGVVNDNGTNDGSFVFPVTALVGGGFLNVPVLVEAGAFRSELVLANASGSAATFRLTYRESLAGPGGGTASVAVPARTQLILPDALQALRDRGVAVGAPGGSYAGSLRVELQGVDAGEAFAGARTAAVSAAAGQFGLFTPAVYPAEEAGPEAWLYGLAANATSRANVAVASTAASGGAITLELTAYDGDRAGATGGEPTLVTLSPGQWTQIGDFLRGKGVANGWVRIRRTEGTSPWLAYAVVNDGGRPGERTGDGAYVPMTR